MSSVDGGAVGLTSLAPGVLAWCPSGAGLARPNAGVVVDEDGVTVVDSLCHAAQAQPLADELEAIGRPVRRLVYSSSHVEYVGGSSVFPLAAVYGTPQISADLELPPNTDGYRRLMPDEGGAFDELATRPVSHVVSEPAAVSAAAIVVPATGQIDQNLVVQVPGAGVVFLGALGWFGVVPPAFAGDPAAWADTLDQVAQLGDVFVPGHGPVGTADDVALLGDYLRGVVDAAGDPSALASGPWDTWRESRFHAVNVERAHRLTRGDFDPPASMLELLGIS